MEQDNRINSDRETYIDALRKELLYLIERELTPLALKYRYSEVPLESKIKWKPVVLLLGNYSSGKSTLINEFLGKQVQHSGQAPTDDCFTVITSMDDDEEHAEAQELDERDGKVLLYDPQYPFEILKKYGDRFASHFRLKKVKGVPKLKNLAIIDTPGMLDSVTEKDRGYDYQEVIGDLAQLSDLVLVLFDPHKAGTVRESYASLRETLPEKTFEDRLIFVLNRIDECGNLEDLLRVYGTLCWNLSQMTGRKDIPRILLTYAEKEAASGRESKPFLNYLANQRDELQQAILNAPKHRLDHLASFVEHHSSRLSTLLGALIAYNKKRSTFSLRMSLFGLLGALFFAASIGLYLDLVQPFGEISDGIAILWGGILGTFLYAGWNILLYKYFMKFFHQQIMANLDQLASNDTQKQRDSWAKITGPLTDYLNSDRRMTSLTLKKEYEAVNGIYAKGAQEIRLAINQLGTIKASQPKKYTENTK
ncbi:MAG: dynamin family protein [Oligoflexales bacterium]